MTQKIRKRGFSEDSTSHESQQQKHSTLIRKQRHKWKVLLGTTVINAILAGFLPSLGILLSFELQDPNISLRNAIRTPIYFIVSWCLADSWSQTAYITNGFKKLAAAASIITALSIAANYAFHTTIDSISSQFVLGIMAVSNSSFLGIGCRLLMTISENNFSENFSVKSTVARGLNFFSTHSLSLIVVPILEAYVITTDGLNHALLMLAALILQTLPAVILLYKPGPLKMNQGFYLTTRPAYALLHQNEIDDSDDQAEVETNLSQPYYTEPSVAPFDGGITVRHTSTNEKEIETPDGTAVPLFTDVELVAGTYKGQVAFSFEDGLENKTSSNDDSQILVYSLPRRRLNDQRFKFSCCRFCASSSLHREFQPLKHPAFYLGLISMTAQKVITIAIWVLLPTLNTIFPNIHFHGQEIVVSSKVQIALVSVITGLASVPVIFIPFTFNSFSYFGHKLTHGISTIIAALSVYGIGKNIPGLNISVLIVFGLSNAISVGTFEPIFKKALLGGDRFQGYKAKRHQWGKIRGLANTVLGMLIFLTALAIELLLVNWNEIDWSFVFYMIAILQLLAGLVSLALPPMCCH